MTITEALFNPNKDKWLFAMHEEYIFLQENGTWQLVELPLYRKVITCKWAYFIKYDSSRNINHYKARLVARGFTQRYGIDYMETFSLVAKFDSI